MKVDSNVDCNQINWAAGRLARDQLMAGKLPDIRIPSLAGETKYCNISLHISAGIEFGFTVRWVLRHYSFAVAMLVTLRFL
jgi:hypothetical protein